MKTLIGKTLRRVINADDKHDHLAWADRIKILDIYGLESGAGMYPASNSEEGRLEVLYIHYDSNTDQIGFVDLPEFRELLGCFVWRIEEEE